MNNKVILALLGLVFVVCACEAVKYKIDYLFPHEVEKAMTSDYQIEIFRKVQYTVNKTDARLNSAFLITIRDYPQGLFVENGTSGNIGSGIVETNFSVGIESGSDLWGEIKSQNTYYNRNYTGHFKAFMLEPITFPITCYYNSRTRTTICENTVVPAKKFILHVNWSNCPRPDGTEDCNMIKSYLLKSLSDQFVNELSEKVSKILEHVYPPLHPGDYPK